MKLKVREKGKKELRKRSWMSFLVVFVPFTVIMLASDSNLNKDQLVFVLTMFVGVYFWAYISGYMQGREALRSVLDFMESGLRWKVKDAETMLNDMDDRAYEKSQKHDV